MTHKNDDSLSGDLFAGGAATPDEVAQASVVAADLIEQAAKTDGALEAASGADLEADAPEMAADAGASGGGGGGKDTSPLPDLPSDADAVPLALFAERAYLEYAVSVVKGRALPHVCDGQKPVQRRILYAMNELGLVSGAKPVKSARVVGDVIGKYHPHGDSSVYEAIVRVAQDFSLRYPLVDGIGNFGSRDGDTAAAMRYTECRLTPIAQLLLAELDMGTVDFQPNYDGAFQEPALLPARLPMLLLNGASGIAVGMATEMPSHNLTEVADAAIALIKKPELSVAELMEYIPAPDFPGGGQIISTPADIRNAYETGRGSLKVRARWKVEELARGQWQLVVYELPPAASNQRILEEIEDLTNPKVKTGKKALTQEQTQTKQLILSVLEKARDESDKQHPVRLVFEPRSSRQDAHEFMNILLAHTSMESSAPINLVAIGLDGRPRQKTLKDLLAEWISFRFATVRRRTEHRLAKVADRIHILEGRHIVFLNIDEVIRIIRESDEPKAALIARFKLSDRQAEDILEIRLRQLARLEGIKIEQELAELREEKAGLEHLLADAKAMQTLIVSEIKADTKKFGDSRRTVVEAAERAAVAQVVVNEPVTVLLSEKGWMRTRLGHGLDLSTVGFKEGDKLFAAQECRTVDNAVILLNDGRACTVPVSSLPGGRGDGVPVSSLVTIPSGVKVAQMVCGNAEQRVLLAVSSGYGFTCRIGDMLGRNKAGKQFITVEAGDRLLSPWTFDTQEDLLAISNGGRLLVFPVADVNELSRGGRGVILMKLNEGDELAAVAVAGSGETLQVRCLSKTGKETQMAVTPKDIQVFLSARARKGEAFIGRTQPLAFFREAPPK